MKRITALVTTACICAWSFAWADSPTFPPSVPAPPLRVEAKTGGWVAHLGPMELSERDFFRTVGDLDKAEEARVHANDRLIAGIAATASVVGGLILWAHGEGEKPKSSDTVLTGQMVMAFGAVAGALWLHLGRNAASLAIAEAAAARYNQAR